jgi:undecaprenyl diphosphate synthase
MQHLAIIPDGNRRWAKQNKLKTIMGHQQGGQAIKAAIDVCLKNGIKYLSIYTFSLENFNRSQEEQDYLFVQISNECKNNTPDLIQKKVRVKFIGQRELFPEPTLKAINEIETLTQDFDTLTINFMFCYGGRQEIIQAVKKLSQDVKNGIVTAETIDEQLLKSYFWLNKTPDPELIIRTSGIGRLSNFFTFQAAYSELMFLDCFWPEVTNEILQNCIDKYQKIARNFGR